VLGLLFSTAALVGILAVPVGHTETKDSFGVDLPPAACVQVPPEIQGTPAAVRLLVLGYQRPAADTLAQQLLAEAEQRFGERSLEAAEALDLLVWAVGPQKRAARARPLAERAFAIKDSLLPAEDPRRAPSLDHLALLAFVAGDTARAWALAERARALREAAYGPQHPEVALSLRLFGDLKWFACEPESAWALYERALAIQDRTLDPYDPEIQFTLLRIENNLGTIPGLPYQRVIGHMRRSLAIIEHHFGPRRHATLLERLGLGQFLSPLAPQEAESLLLTTVAIADSTYAPPHYWLERMYEELINLYVNQFDRAKGMRAAAAGLERFPKGDVPAIAGLFYEMAGDYERAVAAYSRADSQDVAALAFRGRCRLALGAYDAALEDLERAMAVVDAWPKREFRGCEINAMARQAYGQFARLEYAWALALLGDHARSRREFEQVIEVVEPLVGGPESWLGGTVATVRSRFGDALLMMGDPRAALAQFQEAERVGSTGRSLGDAGSLGALLGQARAQRDLGHDAEAGALFARCLEIEGRTLPADHPLVATTLEGLAELERGAGQLALARRHLAQAAAIDEGLYGVAHPRVAGVLSSLAEVELEMGNAAAALANALRAETASRAHTQLVAQSLSERQALGFAGRRRGGLDGVLTAATTLATPEAARESWDALIRSRALVLDEMGARHQAVHFGGDAVAESLARELGRARTRLAHLTVREGGWPLALPAQQGPQAPPGASELSALFQDAQAEKERLEEALARRSAAFRRERERAAVGYAEVAGSLAPDAAIVAFVRYQPAATGGRAGGATAPPSPDAGSRPQYAAFVLRGRTDAPRLVPLGAAESIEWAVRSWRQSAASPTVSPDALRRAGGLLRALVWDPLAPHLGPARRVFLVPDGELHLVHFAALPSGGDTYLVEGGPTLHHLSAERDLVPQEEAASGSGLFALGAPDYDQRGAAAEPLLAAAYRGPRSSCESFRSQTFAPLPATALEVREVGELWQAAHAGAGADTLLAEAATEARLKRAAPGHRVLHVATHGFVLGGACRVAPTARGLGGYTPVPPAPKDIGENPLLLSGLALAGANQRDQAGPDEEDGILTAEEIAALDLSGTEWAVLSACETGLGEVRAGEGVFGLRRAFQVAGVRTLIMSLWAVEDEATRAWMRELYRARLERGLDTAEAVRAASLAVLAERRAKGLSTHPFHWGAFVAAGDWR
jgi:CHAT domain-containing protein